MRIFMTDKGYTDKIKGKTKEVTSYIKEKTEDFTDEAKDKLNK